MDLRTNKAFIFCLTCFLSLGLVACSSEKADATKAYEEAVVLLEEKNSELEDKISKLQTLVDEHGIVIDESVFDDAASAIKDAQGAMVIVEEIPEDLEEIKKSTDTMNSVSYSTVMEGIEKAQTALEENLEMGKQVTNPSEDFLKKRLAKVEHVTALEAATEENDPNGQLHKKGGYTSAIFMTSDLVNQNDVYGNTVLEKGTSGGACVEAYETVEYANKRDAYLATFDGSALSSGSHVVIGTCVIRTSNEMTASNQNSMTEALIKALTYLE